MPHLDTMLRSSEIATNDTARQMLRVGVMVDSLAQPRWVAKVIDEIALSDFAAIVLIVKTNRVRHGTVTLRYRLRRLNEAVYAWYSKIDRMLFRTRLDAFEPVDIARAIPDCPLLPVTPETSLASEQLIEGDIQKIRAYDLDVLLHFSECAIEGHLLDIPRFGVWSYSGGEGKPAAGLWEVFEEAPVTGSTLSILSRDPGRSRVLYQSYAVTDRRSVYRNRNNCHWKASNFVLRKLRELSEEGAMMVMPKPDIEASTMRPANFIMIPAMCKLAGTYALDKVKDAFYFNQWTIAYRIDGDQPVLSRAFGDFQPLIPPKDRFWADPFPWKVDGRRFIFLEEKIFQRRKGHISVLEIHCDGTPGVPVKVLESDVHMSYPFLFEWRGELYMLPETASRRSIDLYRCRKFPFIWDHHTRLMSDIRAADTTLHEAGGLWWMFTNIADNGVWNYDELYIFHAESPLGPWRPHKRNPVKSDARSARPAGRLFEYEGELYRPSQDCSSLYGGAIVIHRVDALTPTEYRETEVSRITPHWQNDLIATHTFNFSDELTVVDMKVRRRRLG